MKSTKDAMLPTGPSETYSEGGLSGEAVVERAALKKVATVDETLDTEPFMLRQHTDEEVADYDKGFECGQKGGQNDDTKSEAWQSGWAEARGRYGLKSDKQDIATAFYAKKVNPKVVLAPNYNVAPSTFLHLTLEQYNKLKRR